MRSPLSIPLSFGAAFAVSYWIDRSTYDGVLGLGLLECVYFDSDAYLKPQRMLTTLDGSVFSRVSKIVVSQYVAPSFCHHCGKQTLTVTLFLSPTDLSRGIERETQVN